MLSDLELLAIEIDTLWTRDERGRLVAAREADGQPAPCLAAAVTAEGAVVALGSKVPDHLDTEVLELASGSRASARGQAPPSLLACASRLSSALGPLELSGGPSYVATLPPPAASPGTVLVSDGLAPFMRALDPPQQAGWRPGEWRNLLDGKLGPWAMSMAAEGIAAICYCSRLTGSAAEAGLRTEPEHRRQGHGAAATAAWARLVIESGRLAFYSTSADNAASQRVAARLGLREIGWIWQVASPARRRNRQSTSAATEGGDS